MHGDISQLKYCIIPSKCPPPILMILWFACTYSIVYVQMPSSCKHPPPFSTRKFQAPMGAYLRDYGTSQNRIPCATVYLTDSFTISTGARPPDAHSFARCGNVRLVLLLPLGFRCLTSDLFPCTEPLFLYDNPVHQLNVHAHEWQCPGSLHTHVRLHSEPQGMYIFHS